MIRRGTDSTKRIARLERRVINAAMKLADAGKGFVFKDDRTVSDVGFAMRLEKACHALRDELKK